MNTYHQKKLAIINDLSGYGRCSLTAAIPVVSALKVQACPVPTAILSNHLAFPACYFQDYTEHMVPYLNVWKQLELSFDGILTGFLGSESQIEIVTGMIRDFKGETTKVIIDPIMGDHGKPYKTFNAQMCSRMRELVSYGDVATPNLTEACILTGTEYKKDGWKREELRDMALKLLDIGPKQAVITGVNEGGFLVNVIAQREEIRFQKMKRVGRERPGTGDIFSAITAASLLRGEDLLTAVRKSAGFVKACILKSEELNIPVNNGVCLEEMLFLLMK